MEEKFKFCFLDMPKNRKKGRETVRIGKKNIYVRLYIIYVSEPPQHAICGAIPTLIHYTHIIIKIRILLILSINIQAEKCNRWANNRMFSLSSDQWIE